MVDFYRKLYKLILSRRYRITHKNIDLLKKEGPKLILPNHVSHIDPQLMSIIIYEYNDFIPVAAARFFKVPVVRYFLRKLDGIKVHDFKKGSRDINLIKTIETNLIEAFKNNKSALIFPSGQLSSDGIERIYNKQSAFSMVGKLPDNVSVIGVRITGLWGSMWSKAWNGKRPVFLSTFFIGIFYFFANLIFFCPKRNVSIEYVDITKEAKNQAKTTRKDFNLFLEKFYNENGPEKPTFIRHLFFFPRIKNKVKTVD